MQVLLLVRAFCRYSGGLIMNEPITSVLLASALAYSAWKIIMWPLLSETFVPSSWLWNLGSQFAKYMQWLHLFVIRGYDTFRNTLNN